MDITILLDTFPSLSETFLYQTILNWQNAGMKVHLLARRRGKAPHEIPFQGDVTYLPSESLPAGIKLFVTLSFFLRLCFYPRRLHTSLKCLGHGKGFRQKLQLAARCLPLFFYQTGVVYFPFGGLAVKYLEYILETEARVVLSLRGSDIHYYPVVDLQYRQRLAKALLLSGAIHAVCSEILACAEKVAGSNLPSGKVVYTALAEIFQDTSAAVKASHSQMEILSVGRLEWAKGLEHGIVAAQALMQRGVSFRWRIIGDGEYRQTLQWAIRDMGLQENVFLCGPMKHEAVLKALQTADVFFHPSIHEGISNAALEAMAVGLPVVAADVGGMSEAIPSPEVGFLVPARDWKTMANVLERLAGDPALRTRTGTAASQWVRSQFTAEKQTAGFMELFDQARLQEPA